MNEGYVFIVLIIFVIVYIVVKGIDKSIEKQKKESNDRQKQNELKKYKYQRIGFTSETEPNSFSNEKLSKEEIDRLKEETRNRIFDLKNSRSVDKSNNEDSKLNLNDEEHKECSINDNLYWNTSNQTSRNTESPKFHFESIDFSQIKNGMQFEEYCANNLMNIGFTNVRTTQVTGDFGVDILADYGNLLYAFQCKFYSNPVGVQAVQEIVAGKHHYSASVGCVITNSEFTKQAVQLAETNGIHLYDYKWIETNFPNKRNYEVGVNYTLTRIDIEDYNNHYYKLYDSLEKFRIYKAYMVAREYDKKKRQRI